MDTNITDMRGLCVRALDGTEHTLPAFLFRAAALPFSWPYGALAALRRRAYDAHRLRSRKLDVPVISVGNITTGGTGKTPFIEWLGKHLHELGRRPAILSRGYRSRPTGPDGEPRNDEALILEQNLPGIPHLPDANRFRAGRKAVADGADCILLDDGFQHLRLARDLDIVLVSAVHPFGGGRTLPAGLLREPLSALSHADLLLITHADAVPEIRLEQLARNLAELSGGHPVIEAIHRPVALVSAEGVEESLDDLTGRKVFLFSAVGSPEAFLKTVTRLGAEVTDAWFYNDHHYYTQRDLNALTDACESSSAQMALTTQKDLVKISPMWRAETPLRMLRIRFHIASGGRALLDAIETALRS